MVYLHLYCVYVTEVSDWIAEFSRCTKTNWNVRDTHTELKLLQRKDFVCHMNDYHHRPVKHKKVESRYKNCNCPATIIVKV